MWHRAPLAGGAALSGGDPSPCPLRVREGQSHSFVRVRQSVGGGGVPRRAAVYKIDGSLESTKCYDRPINLKNVIIYKSNYIQNQKFFRQKNIFIGLIMGKPIIPEGTIKTNAKGVQYIKEDGKWVYLKKPREKWLTPIAKPKEKVSYNYPVIKIPENMKETQYPGYYITEDGKAYRRPGKYDRTGKYGPINEYGLIYLKPAFRGHPKYPEHQYECINISIHDEKGVYHQIKKSIHQLVAEAFVENPNNYTEIDHIDQNKKNNHYTNLRWIDRFTNASEPNAKYYKITDTLTGKVWEGYNLREWAKENYDLVTSRMKTKNRPSHRIASDLSGARLKNKKIWNLIVE